MKQFEKLVEMRRRKGLTQDQVADQLQVARQTVSRWETGEVNPSNENLRRLSKLYGVPLDELVNSTAPASGPDVPAEQENAKPRKTRWIWFAAAVAVLGILISAIVYIATAEQEPDCPIPIEDLERSTASPAPGGFDFAP